MKSVSFVKCDRGSVATVFVLTLVPLCLAVGMAIDYGRVVSVRTATQAALDSALLASASDSIQENRDHFEDYFAANSPTNDAKFSGFELKADPTGLVKATVNVSVPLAFMPMVGMKTMNLALQSEGKSMEVKKLSEVTFRTISAKGVYDKDVYFVTRDAYGRIISRDLVLSYDWLGKGLGAKFTPSVKNEFTMKVPDYNSWAVELVVFIDDSFEGKRHTVISHFSDGPDAERWQKIDGACYEPKGQSQSWEDLGDFDYADFSFTLNCEVVTERTGKVRLVK